MGRNQFSVLMSLYIKEKPEYLNECLKSLKAQSLQAEEIIIILDGPITNDLAAVLNTWSNTLPVKIFPQEKNNGLGIALNIGLSHCKNEIIFRMDTDDICLPNRFKKQFEHLRENPHIDILSCYIEEFSLIPGDLNQLRRVPSRNEVSKYITYKNPINHMGVAYKKSKILSAGGYQHLESMEDYLLWLRCYKNNYIIDNIKESLVHARIGNGILDRRSGINYLSSEWKLHRYKLELLPKENKIKLLSIFILRSVPRLLPQRALYALYKLNRLNKA